MGEFFFTLLVLFFLTVPILRWHAVYVLQKVRRVAKNENGGVGIFTERLIVAATGATGSTLLGLVGLNRLLDYAIWEPQSVFGYVMLVLALALFSVPAFVWEWMYLTGRLEK